MSFPPWADSKEKKTVFGRAKALNADADILSDFDLCNAFVKEKSKASYYDKGHKKYPLYFDFLKKIGMNSPCEQYTLYGLVGVALRVSYTPMRKAYFLNKWLHETDESLKDIYAGRGDLTPSEQRAGFRHLEYLRRVPRRAALIPLSFVLYEGYRKVSDYLNDQQ